MVSFNLSKRKAGVFACLEKEREMQQVGGWGCLFVCFIGNACEELWRTPSHCCVSLSLCRLQRGHFVWMLSLNQSYARGRGQWEKGRRKSMISPCTCLLINTTKKSLKTWHPANLLIAQLLPGTEPESSRKFYTQSQSIKINHQPSPWTNSSFTNELTA